MKGTSIVVKYFEKQLQFFFQTKLPYKKIGTHKHIHVCAHIQHENTQTKINTKITF